MGRSFILRTILTALLISSIHFPVLATGLITPSASVPYQEEKKQDDKKQDDKKQVDEKTAKQKKEVEKTDVPKSEIKEVPKARKQSRPAVVAKPNVKIKPIKINRPKIKKP